MCLRRRWEVFVFFLFIGFPEVCPETTKRAGVSTCKCLDVTPALDNLTDNTETNQDSRFALKGKSRDPVEDCLIAVYIDHLQRPNESYCYPIDYGRGRCDSWDQNLLPECAHWTGKGDACHEAGKDVPIDCKGRLTDFQQEECLNLFPEKPGAYPWCKEMWCYIDPNECDQQVSESYFFPGKGLWYSYETCNSNNYFELWGAPLLDMCEHYEVVEKPYPVMWLSCWACAVMQQMIDFSRYLDEQQDRLSRGQRIYLTIQLLVLVTETVANIRRVPWSFDNFWANYNVYVYVFVHSSVFVRATMMSQIVWDWYDVKLLKNPVIHEYVDGKGWHDEHRAILLVVIFQFLSSLLVFGFVVVTHLLPAFVIYYWIFLLVAAGLVKSRTWVANVGLDPKKPFGRALIMGTNSFLSCMGMQVLVTAMVRVYEGELTAGYLTPLKNDFASRRLDVWWQCHLGKAGGFSMKLFKDQDFINLFLR